MPATPVRCPWVDVTKADYVEYHDVEWGVPVFDDRILFEFLTLEAAQAGLSWYTVLKKRDNYRRLFCEFDPARVARFNKRSVERLMQDSGIIRNRQKIEAAISNARLFLKLQDEFGSFSNYMWRFVDDAPIINEPRRLAEIKATSLESDTLAKDLKSRGFKFTGSTIMYAHMQATGLVNDHTMDCFRRQQIIDAYRD